MTHAPFLVAFAALFLVFACADREDRATPDPSDARAGSDDAAGAPAVAIFAGGCFWCMEKPFDVLDGVRSTTSGFSGGTVENPSYEQVTSGTTGHREAIEIVFDPERVSYATLVHHFLRNIDPTQDDGQFADRGPHYRTAIFWLDEAQKRTAEAAIAELEASGKFDRPIVTEILPAGPFWPAEAYHQDYYEKNPDRYRRYAEGSGRAAFLRRTWQD